MISNTIPKFISWSKFSTWNHLGQLIVLNFPKPFWKFTQPYKIKANCLRKLLDLFSALTPYPFWPSCLWWWYHFLLKSFCNNFIDYPTIVQPALWWNSILIYRGLWHISHELLSLTSDFTLWIMKINYNPNTFYTTLIFSLGGSIFTEWK